MIKLDWQIDPRWPHSGSMVAYWEPFIFIKHYDHCTRSVVLQVVQRGDPNKYTMNVPDYYGGVSEEVFGVLIENLITGVGTLEQEYEQGAMGKSPQGADEISRWEIRYPRRYHAPPPIQG